MPNPIKKLLLVIEGTIPTVDIILRCLRSIEPPFAEIKIVTISNINYHFIFSGDYQILFVRTCQPTWQPLLKQMERYHIRYSYYLDDNFWELKNSFIAEIYQDSHVIDTLNHFIKKAEFVLASSAYLADYIRTHFQSVTVKHVNAGFDFSILKDLTQQPSPDKIKIIYSGSLYRDQDFKEVNSALIKISQEYADKIELFFYGYIPNELIHLNNATYDKNFYSYPDFIKKQYAEHFHIGLAPLADTLANRSKSNLKYREYGACCIAGIYTNISPYRDCVINHENGLLVDQTSSAWYQAIKLLIEDEALRNKIKKMARKDVAFNFSTAKVSSEWQAALSVATINKKHKVIFFIQLTLFINHKISLYTHLMKRMFSYIKSHGFLFTLKKIKTYLFN